MTESLTEGRTFTPEPLASLEAAREADASAAIDCPGDERLARRVAKLEERLDALLQRLENVEAHTGCY